MKELRDISLNEPQIKLFLDQINKHSKCFLRLKDCLFEVEKNGDGKYLISGRNNKGKSELMILTLTELFTIEFEVLNLETLQELYEDPFLR